MDENNRNFILAIVLSIGVLFAWQFFFVPKHPQQQAETQQQQQAAPGTPQPSAGGEAAPGAGGALPGPATSQAPLQTREQALAAGPRVAIDTPSLKGSINLKGGRFDDLVLEKYRETVAKDSPNVVLLSPAGTPQAYYTEQGFVADAGKDVGAPGADTLWKAETPGPLTPQSPVTLTYDNGKGLVFTRTVSVDDNYMFTLTDAVANTGSEPVTLHPYGIVSRDGLPHTQAYYILHEGLIGVLEDGSLKEIAYKKALNNPPSTFQSTSGWLGITDKYWAAVMVPEQGEAVKARFAGSGADGSERFQTDYLMAPLAIAPGAKAEIKSNMFAGAKEVHVVDDYGEQLRHPQIRPADRLGLVLFPHQADVFRARLLLQAGRQFRPRHPDRHLIVKLVLFPLANKSYRAMSKMKKLQPRDGAAQGALQRRPHAPAAGDDGAVQEGEGEPGLRLPARAGADPGVLLALQGAVRHHRDAARAVLRLDQGSVGARSDQPLQPVRAPALRSLAGAGRRPSAHDRRLAADHGRHHVRAEAAQPGAARSRAGEGVRLMPLFFTFMLASFPAGLVIYWAWNNMLSVIQQSVIMSRQGVEIPLFDNLGLKKFFAKATPTSAEGDAEAPNAETKTLKRQAKRAKAASAKDEAKSAESETES